MKHILFALPYFLCLAAIAQPRFTDSTFGTNGRIIKNTSAPYKDVVDMVLQTDGKTVVMANAYYDHTDRVVLLRYNTNGTLDNTFSGNGIADSLFRQDYDFRSLAVKLQPDGKILVCGAASGNPDSGFVARYLPNGSLDVSFGAGGIFYHPPISFGNVSTSVPAINNLLVLPGGKFLLLSSNYATDEDLILTRLNPGGTIDSTWGINGIVGVDAGNSFDPEYRKIEMQTDGKFLVGGNPNDFDPSAGTALNVGVVRLKANGSLDSTYGTNGRVAVYAGPADYDFMKDMALQPDGKVVVSGIGEDYNDNYNYAFVLRLMGNGALDAGFGTGGISIVAPPVPGTWYSVDGQLSLQADGKILLAGCNRNAGSGYDVAVARLTASGAPDTGFDSDGFATLVVNGYTSYAIASQQQADGRIVVSGLARSGTSASATIARLTATGQPDASLNAAGAVAYIGSGTDEESGVGVEIQPDGKIMSINGRFNGLGYDLSITRYDTTGATDATWGSGGSSLVEIPSGYNDFFSGLLSNGKLMLATSYGDYFLGGGVLIARLNASGTTDSSFGTYGKLFIRTSVSSVVNVLPQAAFQPDGKTVLLYTQSLGYNDPDSSFVVRLNTNGTYDNSFNGTGKKFLPDSSYSYFTRLRLQPDGKILIGEPRQAGPNFPGYTAIRRLNTDGSTDATFNNGNTVAVPFGVSTISLQADGKILAGGTYATVARLNSNGNRDSSFSSAGIADLSTIFYNLYGLVGVKQAGNNRLVVLGTAYDSSFSYGFTKLVALKQNGTVDSSFGNAGAIDQPDIPYPLPSDKVFGVQTNGKVLLTGYIDPANTNYASAVLTRLKPTAANVGGRLYTFTGSGLWSSPANWSDGTVPPTTIAAGSSLMIDPPANGECVIDITVHVQAGATVTVKAGKKLRLPGNLIIQ